MRAVLVDAGPLIALIEPSDAHHRDCVETLAGIRAPLLTVWPAFTEAMYLLRGAERSEAALWGMLDSGGLDFATLGSEDAPQLRALMERYRDQPMDLADAALVRIAERDGLNQIFTVDRRNFETYRINRRRRFVILP
jgi:predicted nucleic acid-binding protein